MKFSNILIEVFNFYRRTDTYYRLHSPFLYELVENILEDNRHFYAFEKIEKLRELLLKDKNEIQFEDLGAGSKKLENKNRMVSQIAKTSLSPSYQCKVLFRLANYLKPKTILELGSSLGVSSLYLAEGATIARVATIEGSKAIAALAKRNFSMLKNKNIEISVGNFNEMLVPILQDLKSVDLVYIDGNHQYVSTMKYFKEILPYSKENTVIIFDDIYWSEEMIRAWQEIKKHPRVTQSLDLFFFGLVFFNKEFKNKKDHLITFSKYKPWQKYY